MNFDSEIQLDHRLMKNNDCSLILADVGGHILHYNKTFQEQFLDANSLSDEISHVKVDELFENHN